MVRVYVRRAGLTYQNFRDLIRRAGVKIRRAGINHPKIFVPQILRTPKTRPYRVSQYGEGKNGDFAALSDYHFPKSQPVLALKRT